jgi:hypothetical protein
MEGAIIVAVEAWVNGELVLCNEKDEADMDIEIFTLCDAATEGGGKLNILGTFDRINAHQLPAVHPHCAVAVRVRFDRVEQGEHHIRIAFVNEDGKPVMPGLDGKIQVSMPPACGSASANLILNINGLKFEQAGAYSIDLSVDGRHEKSLPLYVVLHEPKG